MGIVSTNHEAAWSTHCIQLLYGVAGGLGHDVEEGLLLGQHFPPLDLDLNCLALACGRDPWLLEHGCTSASVPWDFEVPETQDVPEYEQSA